MLMEKANDIKTKEQLIMQVDALFANLNKQIVTNLFNANRAYLHSTLEEASRAEAARRAAQENIREAAARRRAQAAERRIGADV